MRSRPCLLIIFRYGVSLGLLSPATTCTHLPSLTSLLTRSRSLLAHHKPSPASHQGTSHFLCPGFDWMTGIIFILTRGHADLSLKFLSNFYSVLASGYVSMPRLTVSCILAYTQAVYVYKKRNNYIKSRRDKIGITRHIMMHQVL